MNQKTKVLVVDDEETIRKLLKGRLEREGYEVSVASCTAEAEKILSGASDTAVMVTDVKMPGPDGLILLSTMKTRMPLLRIIMITGHGEKEVAVQALKKGASDYLEKPFDLDELAHSVKRCAREYVLENENRDLMSRLEDRVKRVEGQVEDSVWYVSKDPAMQEVNHWLTVLRRESMRGEAEEPSVLILGGSGTGKEGIARMVHTGSRRGKGPWVAVNCANFNEQLLDSELFGHERGAFTGAISAKRGLFELAQGGTLFLDEIGEMDVKLQAKLLRVLQEKTFRRVGGTRDVVADVRVVAATHADLLKRCESGDFREDLYHRLSRVVIHLPALRDRREDLLPMAQHFAERAFRARGKKFRGFSTDAEEGIKAYSWPGNVREMLNLIERAALVFDGDYSVDLKILSIPVVPRASQSGIGGAGSHLKLVTNADVPAPAAVAVDALTTGATGENYTALKKKVSRNIETEMLCKLLEKHHGNVTYAAREAKIDRSNFLRLLRRYGIQAKAYRKSKVDQQQSKAA